MLIPIIKVRDKAHGTEHIVGTNHHDVLLVDKQKITYMNLQNCCGTKYDEPYGYEFIVPKPFADYVDPHIEFVTLDEFVKLSEEQITAEVDNTIALYRYFVERENARLDAVKMETGITGDTGGGVTE